jgi:hypothetical protein
LRRTAVGHLRIEQAGPEVRPAAELVAHLPARALTSEEALRVVHGLRLEAPDEALEGPQRLMAGERLLAIARPRDGSLVTEVVLA